MIIVKIAESLLRKIMQHLVIIGNGISGVTTARHVRKHSNMKITIISAESDFFYSRTALMYIYMGHMKFEHTKPYEDWFWQKNKINLIRGFVTEVNTSQKYLKIQNGNEIKFDILVIATGSKSNKFGWKGQDLPGVQGLYSLQDLKLMEANTKNISRAVIVGGGLIGIEMAEMLLSRNIPITFLVREKFFWDIVLPHEEAKMISRHIAEHGIDLRLSTELKEIEAGSDGNVCRILTNKNELIDCQFVGLTVGVHPNIEFLKNSEISINKGVLVNDYLETNIPNVYAVGDCAEIITPEENQSNRIEQLWYTGKMQAETLAKTICGIRTMYDRGIWYNSAKFLDIEYQTYGFVNNTLRDGEDSFYWEHEDGKYCLRIVYQKDSRAVTGFNVFGIRLRQKICIKWIREEQSIEFVIQHLRKAMFDPEFFRKFESRIVQTFNNLNSRKMAV